MRRKGNKPCQNVRLSKVRLPIEQFPGMKKLGEGEGGTLGEGEATKLGEGEWEKALPKG